MTWKSYRHRFMPWIVCNWRQRYGETTIYMTQVKDSLDDSIHLLWSRPNPMMNKKGALRVQLSPLAKKKILIDWMIRFKRKQKCFYADICLQIIVNAASLEWQLICIPWCTCLRPTNSKNTHKEIQHNCSIFPVDSCTSLHIAGWHMWFVIKWMIRNEHFFWQWHVSYLGPNNYLWEWFITPSLCSCSYVLEIQQCTIWVPSAARNRVYICTICRDTNFYRFLFDVIQTLTILHKI